MPRPSNRRSGEPNTIRPEVTAVGVDGCRAGWIWAARHVSGDILVGVARTFSDLIAAWPRVPIAIDIPIGLPATGSRDADRLARARLGRRRSSVFPAPLRAGIEART